MKNGAQEFLIKSDWTPKTIVDKVKDYLDDLEELNPRLSKVVEMRFFGEMTIDETADALDISESTVKRDWIKARGWLYKELKGKFKMD